MTTKSKTVSLGGLVVRFIRNHRKIAKVVFYVGTYAVATGLAVAECGHLLEGLAIGVAGGSVKIGWHFAHKLIFKVGH
jgi:hypothetical protein